MKLLKSLGRAVVAFGLVGTLAILLYSTSWDSVDVTLPILFLWVLLPFVVLLISNFKIHQRAASNAARVVVFVTSLVVVILSLLIYYESIFVSVSSTSALISLFWPLYSLIGIAVTFLAAWLLMRLLGRPRAT